MQHSLRASILNTPNETVSWMRTQVANLGFLTDGSSSDGYHVIAFRARCRTVMWVQLETSPSRLNLEDNLVFAYDTRQTRAHPCKTWLDTGQIYIIARIWQGGNICGRILGMHGVLLVFTEGVKCILNHTLLRNQYPCFFQSALARLRWLICFHYGALEEVVEPLS